MIAAMLAAAFAGGLIIHRFGLPPLVGFLLAGVALRAGAARNALLLTGDVVPGRTYDVSLRAGRAAEVGRGPWPAGQGR